MAAMEWLWFAVAAAVKASLVLTAAFLVTRLMRNRPAAERHLVWTLAAVCVLALPLLSLALPVWRFEVPAWAPSIRVDAVREAAPPRAEVAWRAVEARPAPEAVAVASPPGGRAAVVAVQAPAYRGPAALTAAANSRAAVSPPPGGGAASWSAPLGSQLPGFLFGLWLAGVIAVAARLLFGHLSVYRRVREARPFGDPGIVARAELLGRESGAPRSVRLLEIEHDAMPMTCGLVRASLLLPSSARVWTASRRDAVLRHELAHIRRRDTLTQFLAELGCMLYWFNPLMWWAAHSMCVEREHACDDAVLAAGLRPSDYAAELLAIAAGLRRRRKASVAAIAFAREPQLRTRVAALLAPRVRRDRAGRGVLAGAWTAALLAAVSLSAFAPAVKGHAAASPVPMATAEGVAHVAVSQAAAAPSAVAAAPAPPAIVAADMPPPAVQEDCLSGGRNTRVNSNSNDHRRTIQWSGPNCSGDVLIEGDVRFDDAFTTIVGLSPGGQVRITTEEGRTERRVVIRPDGGGVSFEYAVNGDRQALDREGQEWLSSTLTFLFRRMGFMARERAAAMLARGGPDAVLAEVDLIGSDHVRSQYLTVLVERGNLDVATLRRVLNIAGETIRSDHYRAGILAAVANRYEFDDALRDAYIEAVSSMGSDHYRHGAFSTLLDNGRLTPAQQSAVLRQSRRITSDHYRSQLLVQLADRYESTPEIRAAYLDAAEDLGSDHYKAGVLERLFASGRLTAQDLARVLDAAASIRSDHYRAQVLMRAAEYDLADAALQRSFVGAARGIRSDHYLENVLSSLVARDDVSAQTLLTVLEAAEDIGGDHYRAQLLLAIADRHRLEGEARTRFERLMEGMRSDTYRGRVAMALLRNGR